MSEKKFKTGSQLFAVARKKAHSLGVPQEKGMKMAEMSWILDDNDKMNRPIKAMGGEIYKTYRFYEKPL